LFVHFDRHPHLRKKSEIYMKTPKTVTKEELTKDGKVKEKVAAARRGPGATPPTPGFGMGRASMKPNGTWGVDVKCVNGDPGKNPVCGMPRGCKYYGGREEIPSPSDISVYLPDGQNIDSNYVFPWSTTQADPLRLGGGVLMGTLQEGAQRSITSAGEPLQAPFITTTWVNGTPWRVDFFITNTFGLTLYEGDIVFGLAIMDPVSGTLKMQAMAKREGACLDTPS
jgi:hypothetical protein